MKYSIALILVLGLCICSCGSKTRNIDSNTVDQKRASERVTIAVMDFVPNSNVDDLKPFCTGLTDMFISNLKELLPEANIIERSRLATIMSEFQLAEAGAVDPETAQKIGRILGAQTLYYGGITTLGDQMRLDGRLVRVETSEILSAGNSVCDIKGKDAFKAVDKVSKLAADKTKACYKNLVADVYFSKGRTAEESGDKDGAIRFYQQSLQYSSDHELSQKALERLKS